MPESVKRVCLLTGSSGTLGTAFCKAHADKYDIVAVYRNRLPQAPSQLQRFVDPLKPDSGTSEHPVYAIQADLNEDSQLERVVDLTLARFDRIDLVVHAAVHSVWGSMLANDRILRSLEGQLRMNLIVPLRLSMIVARKYWRDRDIENRAMSRNVVNISSTAGLNIYPGLGQGIYSCSKAALNYLTHHLADEFRAIGIRVNAVAPNSFPRIVPTQRVADAIVQFDGSNLTGKILSIDKGGEQML